MKYAIRHVTTVKYASPVSLARFNVRLKPAPWPWQVLHDYALTIDPQPWTIQEESGPWIVNRSRLFIRDPLTKLTIESRMNIEVQSPAVTDVSAPAPTVDAIRQQALFDRDLTAMGPASYLYGSPMAPKSRTIAEWARPMIDPGSSILAVGNALMHAIFSQFTYDGNATDADTPPAEAFAKKRGVCQDFAHVMIVGARAHGLPAAYVSGYLRTLPPPGKCGDALGWVGFDPTNNCLARTDHIFTAMGRDYSDVAPIDGVFRGGGGQTMTVSVDVAPESEDALTGA